MADCEHVKTRRAEAVEIEGSRTTWSASVTRAALLVRTVGGHGGSPHQALPISVTAQRFAYFGGATLT